MLVKEIKYIVVNDIHTGHRNTDTILNSFNKLLVDMNSDIDILFISGDMFDRYIPVNSPAYISITSLIINMIKLCIKYNIKLRVLEGTPSHDNKQFKHIFMLLDNLVKHIDIKYIDILDIETIEEYGINILYVPDELNTDSNITLLETKKLISTKGLQKVDIVIMHGQFHYQIPNMTSIASHNEESMLSLVNYYIHIGHVHIHSTYTLPNISSEIIAGGSLDRLNHGEEEPKGYIIAKIDILGNCSHKFICNDLASMYITIDIGDSSILDTIKTIEKKLKRIRKGSRIRLMINKGNSILNSIADIRSKFKEYTISIKRVVIDEAIVIIQPTTITTAVNITPTNISELIVDELPDSIDIEIAMNVMKEYI